MSKLVTPQGEILITGLKDLIAPLTDDERKKFEAIHFEMADIHDAAGASNTIHDDVVNTVGLDTGNSTST